MSWDLAALEALNARERAALADRLELEWMRPITPWTSPAEDRGALRQLIETLADDLGEAMVEVEGVVPLSFVDRARLRAAEAI